MNEPVRWDPFKSMVPFGESLFDVVPALLRPMGRAGFTGARMDLAESDNAYHLAVELPGIPKEAIQVGVYENSVTITAEAAAPKAQEGEKAEQGGKEEAVNWLLRERSFGKLSRTVTLPEPVDDANSQARYADGVLYLTLQKKRASQVKRLTVH